MKKSNILLLFSFVLLFLVLKKIGFQSLYSNIADANPLFLFLAFLFTFISFLVWNLKFRSIVDNIERISYFKLFSVLMAGSFVNTITPGARTGGGMVKAHYLSRMSGKDSSSFYAANVIDNGIHSIIFSLLSLFAIFSVFLFLNIPAQVSIVIEAFLLIVFVVALSGYFARKKVNRKNFIRAQNSLFRLLPKVYGFAPFGFLRNKFMTYKSFEDFVISKIDIFMKTLGSLLSNKNKLMRQFILSMLVMFFVYSKTYALFRGFGVHVSFFEIIAVVTLSILVSYFLVVPGGIGVTETAMISLYAAFRIAPDIAAAVAVLDRAIYYFFSLGIGYMSLMYLQFRYGGS